MLANLLDPHFTAWAALVGLAGIGASLGARLLRRLARRDACTHIVRLAGAVVDIEQSIASDLEQAGASTLFPKFLAQSQGYAKRAHNALTNDEQLRTRRTHVLNALLMLLHEDHRRMVDLRSELDKVLAIWAHAPGARSLPAAGAACQAPAGCSSHCA